MKNTLVFLISIVQAANAQWSYLGLGTTQVTNLTVHYDTIYASTYDGIYKKYALRNDTTWLPCGMQGDHVVQTVVPNHQTLVCAIVESTTSTRLYESIDGGISFARLDTAVGVEGVYGFLNKIAHPEGNHDTLLFVNSERRTFNGGVSWAAMNSIAWMHFIKVDPTDHSRIIVGGEGLALNPILATSTDYGDSWTFATMNGFFGGDNAVHALAINGSDWFGAGEGVICKTTDRGNTWTQLVNRWSGPPQWALYIFDIEFSPSAKSKLYATGDGVGAFKVPLFYSSDYGTSWDTLSYPSGHMPHILTLAVKGTSNGDRVFLGGQGVFVFENMFTSVHDNSGARPDQFFLSRNFPNPFNPTTTINYQLPRPTDGGHAPTSHVTLKVFDLLGREVATLVDAVQDAGFKSVEFEGSGLASGVYLYQLRVGDFAAIRKMLLIQ